MQSDKHINNIQELQNGQLQAVGGAAAAAPFAQMHFPAPPKPAEPERPKQASPKPKATWRCDICNYETNVARNLRIHMTSEKHTHNHAVLQQNMKSFQALQALGGNPAGLEQALGALAQPAAPGAPNHPLMGLYPAFLQQLQQQAGQQDPAGQSPEVQLADIAYNHALLVMAHQQQQPQPNQHQSTPQAVHKNNPTLDMEHPDPTLRSVITHFVLEVFF